MCQFFKLLENIVYIIIIDKYFVVYFTHMCICLLVSVMCFCQVSDAEGIFGIGQCLENIQVIAEAYDIAMEITLSEGTCLITPH